MASFVDKVSYESTFVLKKLERSNIRIKLALHDAMDLDCAGVLHAAYADYPYETAFIRLL